MKTFIEASKMVITWDKTMACLRGRRMSAEYLRNVTKLVLTTGYAHPII